MELLVKVNVDEAQIDKLNTARKNIGRQTTTAFDMVENAIVGSLKESWVKDVTVSLPDRSLVNGLVSAIEINGNGIRTEFRKSLG